MQKNNLITHFFDKILQRVSKLAILGSLGMPGHTHLKCMPGYVHPNWQYQRRKCRCYLHTKKRLYHVLMSQSNENGVTEARTDRTEFTGASCRAWGPKRKCKMAQMLGLSVSHFRTFPSSGIGGPTSLQCSQWPLGRKREWSVININWVRVTPCSGPKVALRQPNDEKIAVVRSQLDPSF